MRGWVLIILALAFAVAEGQPIITGTSGTFEQDANLTIMGNSFGIKEPAEPLFFKDFEDKILGNPLDADPFWSCSRTPMTVSQANQRSGSTKNAEGHMDNFNRTARCVSQALGFNQTQKAYINLWFRYMKVQDCICCWEDEIDNGTHTGSQSDNILVDDSATWVPDVFQGNYVYLNNIDKGTRSRVTTNTGTTITTEESMDWDTGDRYWIEKSNFPQFKLWRVTSAQDLATPYMALVNWHYETYTSTYWAYHMGSHHFPPSAVMGEGWYNQGIQIDQGTKGGNDFKYISWSSRINQTGAYYIQDDCWDGSCNDGIEEGESWLDHIYIHNFIDMNCISSTVQGTDGGNYMAIRRHNSGDGSVSRPETGSDWQSYWIEGGYDTDTQWQQDVDYYDCEVDVWAKHYYDDIYIDNTWARVEIGDNASYDECTHREVQIPVAWNETEVRINVKKGSLHDNEDAYLFLVDGNGSTSEGYPIAFSDGAHPADLDSDGSISTGEIRAYTLSWKSGEALMGSLVDAIRTWKGG